MSEELLQRDLVDNPEKIGKWDFRNIGSTTLNALKNAGIIPKKDYKSFEKRKPDGIITSKKEVIAIVENKDTSKFKTAKQKSDALKQGLDVAQVLNAKILILTDTVDTIWINAFNGEEILDEKGIVLKTNFNAKNLELPKLMEQIIDSIDKNNSQIKEPRLKDPTRLAKSVWQDLWMAAGATPENCLYSFVELFIFKYLSDLGILKEHLSYDFIMKMFENQNEQVVLEYYADNVRKHIKQQLFPVSSDDNTTIINGTIFVSKDEKAVEGYGTVFHKILRKFGDEKEGGGELRNIDKDFKSKLFETFLKESISKKNWGQYFTPLKVVRAMVKMAESEIKEGITICDPACGVGKFLLEPLLINNNIEHFYEVKNNKLISKITLVGKDKGFDKEEQKTIILAKANMLIYMSDMIRKYPDLTPEFSNLFNDTFELKTKNILGTLRDTNYEGKIDLILTNPPYVTTGSSNLKEEIVKCGLQNHYKINANGVEGLFMEWIVRALKPGGKAFVVVPDGIFDNGSQKHLRKFILDECYIDGIISLPNDTFFTTDKKTYILCLTKKQIKTQKQIDPVFLYLISEIGESRDVYRFDIEENDLIDAADFFNMFKNNKQSFSKINKNSRCKLLNIDYFEKSANKQWVIDKCWNDDELINLGILKKNAEINIEQFPYLLEDMSLTIEELKEELKDLLFATNNDIIFKEYKMSDLFDFPSIKGLTKTFIRNNAGIVPVYGGRQEEIPIGFIADNLKEVKYFDNCLGWNREGSVGYVFYHQHKFTTNDHHRPLLLKEGFQDVINVDYIRITLQELLFKQGFRWSKTASKEKVQDLNILIPIDKEGNISIEKQTLIAEKSLKITEIKTKIQEKSNHLFNIKVI